VSAADAEVDVLVVFFIGGQRGACHRCERDFEIGETIFAGFRVDGGFGRVCASCLPLLSRVLLWERRL
jgi:hypothetical protein